LALGFATADVVVFGQRLDAVAELLAVQSVAAFPARFAELVPTKPFITKIEVKPFREQVVA